jgi:adsorption protein B
MLLARFPWEILHLLDSFDRIVFAILIPLAWALLASGMDDLAVDVVWACAWLRAKLRAQHSLFPPGPRQLEAAPQSRIAVLVPLWRESGVIARMLEHNLASIRYSGYHIFAGCYPNDPETEAEVQAISRRFANVHVCLCPHNGPTSKADCLNWIYQHLLLYEETSPLRFEIIVTHDAEDVIHPAELAWINYYAARYDFVQVPVLALPNSFFAITHGVYCDEFAEYHSRDMSVRAAMGGFIPSSGVGTGYRRHALDLLAQTSSNRVFEPASLTEDYENGLRLFRLGCIQAFIPLARTAAHGFVATREFFPETWPSALRQRTRWVMGIALQGWERYGWSGRIGEVYWLWRDRKGLLANPLSLLANLLLAYGVATAAWERIASSGTGVVAGTLALQLLRTVVRMACSARVYGFWFALGVPIRAVYANALNSVAAMNALARYTIARVRGQPLTWLKTAHSYPTRATLLSSRRRIGEILVGSGYLTASALDAALASRPEGVRLGEHLMSLRQLTEESLYSALSVQQALPVVRLEPHEISPSIARSLPQRVVMEWRVLPFRVEHGSLCIAGTEAPCAKLNAELESLTALEIRFHLVTPSTFERLRAALL